MKRSPLKQRTPMKKRQPKRDWTAARAKMEQEAICRCWHGYGECRGKFEAAHVIGRAVDLVPSVGGPKHLYGEPTYPVLPERIIPLCTRHHRLYDAHELDILPALTLEEQLQAVSDAGGLENARVRTAPSQYRQVTHGSA